MPAAATTIGGRPGQQALDVNVLLNILKKAIVLIPIIVMIIVFLIKRHLPEDMVGDGIIKFLSEKKIFHINIISVYFIQIMIPKTMLLMMTSLCMILNWKYQMYKNVI